MNSGQKKQIDTDLTNAHKDYEVGLNKRAFFKVSNRMLGQDLVQDTFLKTWKFLMKGGKIDIMKAFLYHVLNNLIVDEYRKHKPVSLSNGQSKNTNAVQIHRGVEMIKALSDKK